MLCMLYSIAFIKRPVLNACDCVLVTFISVVNFNLK